MTLDWACVEGHVIWNRNHFCVCHHAPASFSVFISTCGMALDTNFPTKRDKSKLLKENKDFGFVHLYTWQLLKQPVSKGCLKFWERRLVVRWQLKETANLDATPPLSWWALFAFGVSGGLCLRIHIPSPPAEGNCVTTGVSWSSLQNPAEVLNAENKLKRLWLELQKCKCTSMNGLYILRIYGIYLCIYGIYLCIYFVIYKYYNL